jgi:hypothetical protein
MKTVGTTEIENRLGRYIEMALREPIFIGKTNRRPRRNRSLSAGSPG